MLHHQFSISAPDRIPPMDALTQFYGSTYRLNVPRESWDSVRTNIRIWESEGSFFTLTKTSPFQLFRPELSADQAQDRLVIILALDTNEILDIGDTMHRMRPGSVAIFDSKKSLLCKGVTGGQQCWFGATYAQLGLSPGEIRTPVFLDPETCEARALTTQAKLVAAAFSHDTEETSDLLHDALLQVLRRLLTERTLDTMSDSFRAMRWRNMQAFIEDNLGSRDLNATILSERFGMSRAVVYRTFEAHGGVTAYIRERRLARIFSTIATAADTRVHLGHLSEALGFVDSAHLSNSFRKAFGTTPSALRGAFRQQAGVDSPIPLLSQQGGQTVSTLLLAA